MKSPAYISWLALALALVAFVKSSHLADSNQRQETAYQRVMRTHTLRCGYALWPVMEDIDPATKELKGLVPDFTASLAAKLGIKIDWVQEVTWGEQVQALENGKIDALCAPDGPFVYTSAAYVDYTDPVVYGAVYLFGRKGETRFKKVEDIDNPNVTISAIDGDISSELATDNAPHAHLLELPGTDDPSLIVENVATGKADLLFEDPFTVQRANKGNADHALVKIFPQPFAVISVSYSVAKGQSDLLKMLNQGFALVQATGEADKILNKYDPEHICFRPAKPWVQNKD